MIEVDIKRLEELIYRLSEGLSVEVKRWIDPASPDGIAKIVRAVFALRNHGGGYFIVGFDDATLQPDQTNVPPDIHGAFHIDIIQRMVTKYASEPFEVAVAFPVRDGQVYPVIVVPPGVRTPVVVKSDLFAPAAGPKLLSIDDVHVRTLRSNNTPSTAKIGWKDWPTLMETCFDNREADIGRFLRRHLGGITPEFIRQLASSFAEISQPTPTATDKLNLLLEEGRARFERVKEDRSLELPAHGTWEVALLVNGQGNAFKANQEFLNLLDASNPELTGWPVWLDSRNFSDESSRPYIADGAWEAMMISVRAPGIGAHIDFMRLDPQGKFYLRRAPEDDLRSPRVEPLTVLDYGLVILRTAEAIAVGIAFAKAMGYQVDSSTLSYAFRWTGLRGRLLASWANPERFISSVSASHQEAVQTIIDVPLNTPLSALATFVAQAVEPVFGTFGGHVIRHEIIEDLTRRLIERRL